MPNAARLTDAVDGTTAGEHSGHVPPHSPEPFTGEISGACSGDVRINGLAAATVGSVTTERDGCCGSSKGAVAAGSGTVRINGKAAARTGDALAPHSGSESITGGSGTVQIGGYCATPVSCAGATRFSRTPTPQPHGGANKIYDQ